MCRLLVVLIEGVDLGLLRDREILPETCENGNKVSLSLAEACLYDPSRVRKAVATVAKESNQSTNDRQRSWFYELPSGKVFREGRLYRRNRSDAG